MRCKIWKKDIWRSIRTDLKENDGQPCISEFNGSVVYSGLSETLTKKRLIDGHTFKIWFMIV